MTTDAARSRQRFSGHGWSLDVHDAGDLRVYTLRGEFDFAVSAELATLVTPDDGGTRVVADLTEVEYCDSSCLQVLLRLARRLHATGGRFAVVTTSPAVSRPITLLGLGDVMPVHPALEAVEAAWGAA
ncbi:STAS domain-containing protein [Amycolatopsis vancoresmycina]|uniref:Anti-sigma factor antagonist n=1 Tax=Amycolatopsis vancoresmycina DSM 44592 TaxID=1292037 RepID=R1FRQ1_9PSEU|nr:STAS domain-containing protein [Amycolatopsis vancoresmycina]EOD62083.1 anti-sigma-factor antagonist [Amycolatopsis vancoresmycina DSM 44592]